MLCRSTRAAPRGTAAARCAPPPLLLPLPVALPYSPSLLLNESISTRGARRGGAPRRAAESRPLRALAAGATARPARELRAPSDPGRARRLRDAEAEVARLNAANKAAATAGSDEARALAEQHAAQLQAPSGPPY
jgi:hypothetical protein